MRFTCTLQHHDVCSAVASIICRRKRDAILAHFATVSPPSSYHHYTTNNIHEKCVAAAADVAYEVYMDAADPCIQEGGTIVCCLWFSILGTN